MMKIKKIGLLLSLALVVAGGRAEAAILAVDNVPAATLLLPYFEVDLGNPNGVTTLFSINNASATAILVHAVLWTDLGVPSYSFNVYLTGYDIQTVNVRDVLNGNFPQTASAGQDPMDKISPKGPFSQDINFASCNGKLPPPSLPAGLVAELQAAHTGGPAATLFGGGCGGQAIGDNIARGYITMDTVNSCTPRSPGDVGYFTGDITFQNVLWGDYFYVNPGQNVAEGDALVAVEAAPGVGTSGQQPSNPATTTANHYTFYGRYTSVPWNAEDHREPLGSKFAARFVNGGAFTGGTRFFVWRDPKVAQGAFVCPVTPGVKPLWYPLGQEEVVVFDEQENPTLFTTKPFPAAANATQIGGPGLPTAVPFGWIYLSLNALSGVVPTFDPNSEQAVVSNMMTASGRFAVSQSAIVLENAAATTHGCIGTGPPPCTIP